jgi:predicted RNase H-like HicB family nuclease
MHRDGVAPLTTGTADRSHRHEETQPRARRREETDVTEAPGHLIVIEQAADGGFGACAPDLRGMREDGEPLPVPSAIATAYVDVDAA